MSITQNKERRLSGMLFNYQTVTKNDFRRGDLPPKVVTEFFEKPRRSKVTEYRPLKNVETVDHVKNGVPFDLYIKSDPIHGHDPRTIQKPYKKIVKLERSEKQKNRPRCVMTPAIRLDAMENDDEYALIVNDMYKSTVHKAMSETAEAIVNRNPCKAPFPGTYAHCKPIDLQLHRPVVVPAGWRKETFTWDSKLQRGHTDATQEFWIRRHPPKGSHD